VTLFKAGVNATDVHYAIVDLSNGYQAQGAASVKRGFALINGFTQLLIVDEFDFASAPNVTWAMHTPATIDIAAASNAMPKAELKHDGRILNIEVMETPMKVAASFSKRSIYLEPPQEPLKAPVNKLSLTSVNGKGRFVVSMSLSTTKNAPVRVRPLGEWEAHGPIA